MPIYFNENSITMIMVCNNNSPEDLRRLNRMVYGHENWLYGAEIKDGKVTVMGGYGHRMVSDGPIPASYSKIAIFNEKGPLDVEYKLETTEKNSKLTFDDTDDDIYTVYFGCESSIIWVITDEGWFNGLKKDFKNVYRSAAYQVISKKVISKTGTPGTIMNSIIDMQLSCVKPKKG
jgi:hypothetical protein